MADWALKRWLSGGEKTASLEKHVEDFELSHDDAKLSDFEPSKPKFTLSWGSQSSKAPSTSSKAESSVVFDAEDFSDRSSDPGYSSPRNSLETPPPVQFWPLGGNEANMRFVTNARRLGAHGAVLEEVKMRHEQRIDEFLTTLKHDGPDNAIMKAEDHVTHDGADYHQGWLSRDYRGAIASQMKEMASSVGERQAASWVIGKIQNHHHLGQEGKSLTSKQIAASFTHSGGDIHAADITGAYLDVSHNSIRANELSDLSRPASVRSVSPARSDRSTASAEGPSRDQDRSREHERDRGRDSR